MVRRVVAEGGRMRIQTKRGTPLGDLLSAMVQESVTPAAKRGAAKLPVFTEPIPSRAWALEQIVYGDELIRALAVVTDDAKGMTAGTLAERIGRSVLSARQTLCRLTNRGLCERVGKGFYRLATEVGA